MTRAHAFLSKATFIVMLMNAATSWSQVNTAAYVLTYPISARAAAMGETGVADNSDPANIFFNPANVVGSPKAYVQGSRWDITPLFADDLWTGGGSAGISYDREGGSLRRLSGDLSYGRFDYGESVLTDPTGAPLGTYHSKEEYYALTIGAGLSLSDRWNLRVGGAIKRWDADLAPAEVSTNEEAAEFDAFAYDIGTTLALQASVTDWSITPAFAVAFVDAGPDVDIPEPNQDDPLPTRFQFGTSVRIESPTTRILSSDVPVIAVVYNVDATERLHGGPFSWGIGGELAVAQILFVRAGSADFDDEEGEPSDDGSGWGVGLGIPAGPFRARFDFTKTTAFYEEDKYGFAINWLL